MPRAEMVEQLVLCRACSVPGCEGRHYAKGWCQPHYRQAWRGDTPGPPRRQQRSHEGIATYVAVCGYRVRSGTTHPLATGKQGRVYEHRAVLFDAIGYGPHRCHWCGCHVNWNHARPDLLVTDHLNEVKTDNRISNLVPSCHGCNSRRSIESRRLRRAELASHLGMTLPQSVLANTRTRVEVCA